MAHEDYQEMLAGRALNALDDADLRELDEHLATCADCRQELAALSDAASLMAYGAPPVEPRAEVGMQIMDQVRSGRAVRAEPLADVIPIQQRRQMSPGSNLLKLAAAIAFVALMIGLGFMWRRDLGLRREVARLSQEVNTQQRELEREQERLQSEREAIALLTAPDAKRTELSGTQEAKDAHATFAFDRQTGRAVLLTEGLPATPADKAYELWFIANGRPLPGKVFTVDASGRAAISDQVPPEARGRAVFAITLEPKSGVSAPTGPIYLSSPSS